jgi:hypothetical protein
MPVSLFAPRGNSQPETYFVRVTAMRTSTHRDCVQQECGLRPGGGASRPATVDGLTHAAGA